MYSRALSILLVLLVVGGVGIAPTAAFDAPAAGIGPVSHTTPADGPTISVDETGGEQTVIVRLVGPPETATQASTTAERKSRMRAHAADSQTTFERFAAGNPHVTIERSFWITNGLVVTVDTDRVPLERLGFVENVEAVYEDFELEINTASAASSSTPSTQIQPSLATSSGDDATWGLETIRAPDTWADFDNRGEGVRIAVLDTGVDPDHPDITITADEWKDFNDEPSPTPKDYGSHGTHVSGTVVGGNASGTAIGVAPEAELYHGAVLTECEFDSCAGTFSQIIDGIQWAVENDADVVSMSLGASGYRSELIDPVRNARTAGTIPVTSSGNSGSGSSSSPGNIYDAFSVGATTESEDVAWFSSGEEIVTQDAWGSDAPSDWPSEYVVPDISAPGDDVYSAVPDEGYETKSGTSMAAPHISGAIALMLSNGDGELSPTEIEQLLTAESVDIGEDESRQGAGRLDVYNATLAHSRATLEPTISPQQANASVSTTLTVEANHPIEAYHWTFENGTTVTTTEPAVNHTFTEAGNRTVSLTLEDERGTVTTVDTPITVWPPSTVSITAPANESVLSNETITIDYELSNTSFGGVDGVEYRLTNKSADEIVTDWTDAPYADTNETVSKNVSTGSLTDASYRADLRLVDGDGNPIDVPITTDSVGFTVKTVPPAVDLTVESAGEFELFGPNNPARVNVTVDDPLDARTGLSITDADDTEVASWNLSSETGSGERTTVEWNATADGSPVDSGRYNVTLSADDGIGNTVETTETITVDTDSPTVSLDELANVTTADGNQYFINATDRPEFELTATDGRSDGGQADSVSIAVDSLSTNHRRGLNAVQDDNTTWTGTFDASRLGVEGSYELRLTATDRAGNVNRTTISERLEFSSAEPEIVGTIVDSNGTDADVVVRSDKPLAGDPTATATGPNDSTQSVSLTGTDGRWEGSFETDDGGVYELAVAGTDRHGNSGSDTSSVRADTASSIDGEVVIYNDRTGTFVHIETDQDVENQFVVVSESARSPETLRANQSPVGFLTSTLADELAGNITTATVGIPAATYEPPAGLSPGDDRLEISYYNANTESWEDRATRFDSVAAGEFADEIEGDYWLTTVDSFSTYGVTAANTEPPEITSRSPASGETLDAGTDSVTIDIAYEDELSSVNVSAIEFRVDGNGLVDDENTDITAERLTHTDLVVENDTSYAVDLYLEDTAENGQWYNYTFSVGAETDGNGGDDDNGSSDDGSNGGGSSGGSGGSGGGGGGGGGGSGSGTPRAIPTPVPDDVQLLDRSQGTIRGGDEVSIAQFGSFLQNPVVGTVIFEAPGLDGRMEVRDYDAIPGGMGTPPGEMISTSEILVPWQFADTSARIRFSLDNSQSSVDLDAVDSDALTVWRHTGGEWEPLETRVHSGSGSDVVLEATTPGFSYFVVTDAPDRADALDDSSDDIEPDTVDDEIPGFGVVTAIVGLLAVLVVRRLQERAT